MSHLGLQRALEQNAGALKKWEQSVQDSLDRTTTQDNVTATPTRDNLPRRMSDFGTLGEALDYAARGVRGLNFHDPRGNLARPYPYAELRRDALDTIGGFAALHDALIDDCTLARRVKDAGGRIWLGLYGGEGEIEMGIESWLGAEP